MAGITIDWGDGKSDPVTLTGKKWKGSHKYTTPGDFTVTVKDDKGKPAVHKSFTAKAKEAPKAPDAPKAAGANGGAPGNFTPTGALPADLAAVNALGLQLGATGWTVGQYVTLGDKSEAHWTGATWAAGKAPAPAAKPKASDVSRGTPGTWEPTGAAPPADLAALTALALSPGTAWTSGQYVTLGDASEAHWSGTAWAAGKAV